MNNDFLDKKNVKKILLIALAIILIYVSVQHLSVIGSAIAKVGSILFPFILGACIAFIFNVPMSRIESLLFKKHPNVKGKRGISYLITFLLVVAIIVVILVIIVPQIGDSVKLIADDLQSMGSLDEIKAKIIMKFPQTESMLKKIDVSYEALIQQILKLFSSQGSDIVNSTVSAVGSVVSGLATFLIGFTFSIYVLFRKEALGVQGRKILYAFFNDRFSEKFLRVSHLTYQTFASFLRGQCLEACILGTMFFVVMSIFSMPYAMLVSVFIAVTALIPVFGAWMGCIVGVLLILVVSPKQAFWFIIMFLVLQQLEGKLIYPHVVGGKVGLPSIWVLFAITVGAELNGVVGMIVAVPLCSVIYALFREFIHGRLDRRGVEAEKYLEGPKFDDENLPQSKAVLGSEDPDVIDKIRNLFASKAETIKASVKTSAGGASTDANAADDTVDSSEPDSSDADA